MSLLLPPFEGISGPIPLLRLVDIADKPEAIFSLEELEFDHIFHRLTAETTAEDLPRVYTTCIQQLDILHKDYSECLFRLRNYAYFNSYLALSSACVQADS